MKQYERIFKTKLAEAIDNIKGFYVGYTTSVPNKMLINSEGHLFKVTVEYVGEKEGVDMEDLEKILQ